MAEKTMHHAVIGADTFELVDQSARADVSDLKNALNNQTVLFDSKANKAIDIANQGNEINYNNFTVSDYIPIGEHVLLIDTNTAIVGSSALYDANKTYIGGISFPVGHTILTQTDGAYVRFSCQTSVFPSVKVSNLRLDKTLSVPDAYADSYSTGKIRDTVSDYQDNVNLVKNLVESVTEGYYVANSTAGKKVSFNANSSYGYTKVYVEGGKDYTVNSTNYSNSFTVVADAYDTIIGLLSAYATSVPTVYHMPSNAAYVVFCAQQLSSSGTKDIVVMRGSDAITDATISAYPYGVTKAVRIKNLTEDTVSKYLSKSPFINTVERQILDVNKWESGYIWMASGSNNVTKTSNPSYFAYPPIEVKAGSYNIVNLSGNFSFAIYKSDGTRHNLNTLWSEGGTYRHIGYTLTLPEDSILYLSNSNVSLSMIATGAFIMNAANTAPAYVYGEYNPTTKHVYYCGHGRPLNTLRAAIEEATKYFDSTVYVDNETFDIAQEFADVLPTIDGTNQREGITLKNRVHVIFASGAKVVFDYDGNNENVYSCFSPFNGGEYGFTLENAWVESKNCRYAVHDELNASAVPYHNVYKHCTFIHDSSESSWGAHQAIGGGLGRFGDILIEDCYASSVGAYSANLPVISYHNAGVSAVARSTVTIRGTYVADGSIRVTNQGANTVKSRAMISGCNVFGVAPYYEKTISADRADNMELYQWNNVVRTE